MLSFRGTLMMNWRFAWRVVTKPRILSSKYLFVDLSRVVPRRDIILFVSCHGSGDPAVESFEGTHLVFVGAGSDPFEVITNSVK